MLFADASCAGAFEGSNSHTAYASIHSRRAGAPAGVRAVDAVPKNWGDNITVAAALTLYRIVAPMMLYGAMNTRAFEASMNSVAPELRPGDVVVLDKLSAH